VEQYIEAQKKAITQQNILSGWRGAGLFSENMYRILQQIPETESQLPTMLTLSSNTNNHTPYFLTSSPPDDPAILQSTNYVFLAEISNKNIDTPIKTQIRRLSNMTERLQVDVTILKEDIMEVKKVHVKRKERVTGKHHTLKNRPFISSEGVAKALQVSEKATKAKKKSATRNHRNRKRKAVSSDEDITSSSSDSSDSLDDDPEVSMLECIEVS
jgi:hypothetical protein